MIIPEQKILFIHIPKTGGSAIEYAMLASQGIVQDETKVRQTVFSNELGSDTLKKYLVSTHEKDVQHATAEWYKSHLKDFDDYYKFTVVRNPYDRFVSEFYWQKSLDGGAKLKADKLQLDMLRNKTATHYKHQHKFLQDSKGNNLVDQVFRFEDFPAVRSMLENKLGKQLPWLHLKVSQGRPSWKDFMNDHPDVAHFIKYNYAKDFKDIGYTDER